LKNYQSNILKEATNQPTKLDFTQVLYPRTKHPTKNDFYSLKNAEAGALGEQIVLNYLKKHGKEDWIVIRNMWLNYDGPFEADFMLLTRHRPYLLEVKNYSSDYTYENGVSTWNNNTYSGNPVNQTIRNTINLQNIWTQNPSGDIKPKGALLLVGVDSHVEIKSGVSEIDIIDRPNLRKFIRKIVQEEQEAPHNSFNLTKFIKSLERYEIHNLQKPKPLSDQQISKLRKGICCINCQNFDIKIGRKYVTCNCGCTEEREIAILRTICEYAVLTYDRNIKTGPLGNFINKDISMNSLRKVLQKYFVINDTGSSTSYSGKKLPLEKLHKDFDIDKPIKIDMSLQDYADFNKIKQLNNY
jgi:hypothetical protein